MGEHYRVTCILLLGQALSTVEQLQPFIMLWTGINSDEAVVCNPQGDHRGMLYVNLIKSYRGKPESSNSLYKEKVCSIKKKR